MKSISKISVLAIAIIVAMAGMAFAAELSLTKFTASPSSFKKGQAVGFNIEVNNPNTAAAANPGEVYFYVNDGTPEHEGPQAFLGTTHLPSLAPGKTTVHLAQTYTVPAGAENQISFTVILPPITPGVEFGPSYQYKYNASCTYSPEMRIMPLGMKALPMKRFAPRKSLKK